MSSAFTGMIETPTKPVARPAGPSWSDAEIRLVLVTMARLHALAWGRAPAWLAVPEATGADGADGPGEALRRRRIACALAGGRVGLSDSALRWLADRAAAPSCGARSGFRTLIHDDLSARTVRLRVGPEGPEAVFCGWESMRWGAPQRDVVAFLAHALERNRFPHVFLAFVRDYHDALGRALARAPALAAFCRDLIPAAVALFLDRTLAALYGGTEPDRHESVPANLLVLLETGAALDAAAGSDDRSCRAAAAAISSAVSHPASSSPAAPLSRTPFNPNRAPVAGKRGRTDGTCSGGRSHRFRR